MVNLSSSIAALGGAKRPAEGGWATLSERSDAAKFSKLFFHKPLFWKKDFAMYKPSRRLGLSLLVCFAVATPLSAALVPANLRCEYAAKPLAIESPEPRLSWILHADPAERGQRISPEF